MSDEEVKVVEKPSQEAMSDLKYAELEEQLDKLPKICNNKKCCGKQMQMVTEILEETVLVPLKKVEVRSELRGAIASTTLELTYVNPGMIFPIECSFVFPVETSLVLVNFEASIDGRVIETRVKQNERAEEMYEDAVAGGNVAILARKEHEKDKAPLCLKLGNLGPRQEAILKLQLVSELDVVAGHYCFILPMTFYPDYNKHGIKNRDSFVYEFGYSVKIVAQGTISSLSLPSAAQVTERSDDRT